MQKTEFVQTLTEHLEQTGQPVSQKTVKTVVDAALDVITQSLARGEKVTLTGFGTFEVRDRQERTGTNPATGERMVIPASKAPAWSASSTVKDAVRSGAPAMEEAVA
jgi:DNA-binding protein HU-beta